MRPRYTIDCLCITVVATDVPQITCQNTGSSSGLFHKEKTKCRRSIKLCRNLNADEKPYSANECRTEADERKHQYPNWKFLDPVILFNPAGVRTELAHRNCVNRQLRGLANPLSYPRCDVPMTGLERIASELRTAATGRFQPSMSWQDTACRMEPEQLYTSLILRDKFLLLTES